MAFKQPKWSIQDKTLEKKKKDIDVVNLYLSTVILENRNDPEMFPPICISENGLKLRTILSHMTQTRLADDPLFTNNSPQHTHQIPTLCLIND